MSTETDACWRRAEAAFAKRDFAGARRAIEQLLAHAPGHAPGWLRRSALDSSQGRVRAATEAALRAAATSGADPSIRAMVAGRLQEVGESRAAAAMLRGLETANIPAPVAAECARLSSKLGDQTAALRLADRAVKLGLQSPQLVYLRATALLFCGNFDEAQQQLEACLAAAPEFHQVHWTLAKLRRWGPADHHVDRLRKALAVLPPGHPGAAYVAYALFKELDDLGDQDAAWDALMRGCAERRHAFPYDGDVEQALFEGLQARFDERFLAGGADAIGGGPAPIFVLGMPRSGSTLLERILGAHPQVADAGELFDLAYQLRWATDRQGKGVVDRHMVDAAAGIDFGDLGRRYLAQTAWRAAGQPFFTDKLPANFQLIGFIHRALPQARILHTVRDPMDTCFSNLKELFGTAYPHSYDLQDMARHYRHYRKLMAHWHARLPGRILDVSYERLVADPQAVAREVTTFCGLEWDPACVAVERRVSPSSTASSIQVREPIHARNVAQWQRYAGRLEPLRSALGEEAAQPG